MAMDYFKERYAGLPVVFDMSLVYIVVAFLTVLANNLLVETFSLNARINFGESKRIAVTSLPKLSFRIFHVFCNSNLCGFV